MSTNSVRDYERALERALLSGSQPKKAANPKKTTPKVKR